MHFELVHFVDNKYCGLDWGNHALSVKEPGTFEEASASEVIGVFMNTALPDVFFREDEMEDDSDEYANADEEAESDSTDHSTTLAPFPPAENTFFRTIAALENLPSNDTTDVWTQDYFYKAFSALVNTPRMDSWMLFAAQILWDTQVLLGANTGESERELIHTAKDLCQRYRACKTLNPGRKEVIDKRIARVRKMAVGNAFQEDIETKMYAWKAIDASETSFTLLGNHPGRLARRVPQASR
jgi:hypothetical protein